MDDFIRTSSDPRHGPAVEKFWRACVASGDIYRAQYRGLYCVGCERFYAVDELQDGLCPEHLRPPEEVSETNYFFRLTRYADRLHELIASGELKVLPETRRTEILSLIESGLTDFSISRSVQRSRGWGIPVPGDPSQVIYVWFDALINYISALGYGSGAAGYERFWLENPARIHVIGKGILRFHAAYWPAMLLSAGIPLPTKILVHGYLTTHGRKISKSLGSRVDPQELAGAYGPDALRYYLLSQFRPGHDGDFSEDHLLGVRDGDLADQLGNLVSRVASMASRYRGGHVTRPGAETTDDAVLARASAGLLDDLERCFEEFEAHRAVSRVWDLVREANRYVVREAPWELARRSDTAAQERLSAVLYNLLEALRLIAACSAPFIPSSAAKIAGTLGLAPGWEQLSESTLVWGAQGTNFTVGPSVQLFPKA